MSEQAPFLSQAQLIDALSLTSNAIAVHVGEKATIQFANKIMLRIWNKDYSVIGKALDEVLPELDGQPFMEMFAKVWHEGVTITGTDTVAYLITDGVLKPFYFDFEYTPVKDEEGNVIAILHSAMDVTERYLNREMLAGAQEKIELLKREQLLNEELGAANEEMIAINEELSRSREELAIVNQELESIVEDRVKDFLESEERFRTMAEGTEILIAVGDENGTPFYFNKAWTVLTGKSLDSLIASGWVYLLHPDDYQKFINIHKMAWERKKSYTDEFRLLAADGNYHWILKKGTPRFLSNGKFAGYISSCIDITDRKEFEEKLQAVHEELATSNEELVAINEELKSSVEELARSNNELVLSEQRFRNLITQAPFGICVISAKDLIVTEVNDDYLNLVGHKKADLHNCKIWDKMPEFSVIYAPVLEEVIQTGIAYVAKEEEVAVTKEEVKDFRFLDFVYEPVKNTDGLVTSVMVVVMDVTDKVKARKSIEDIEERIRLAVESAEIGTYEFNYVTNTFTSSDRFNQIFRIAEPVTREQVIAIFHPSDVHFGNQSDHATIDASKVAYETRLVFNDNSQHWVRIHGQVYFNGEGIREKLLGTVLDITEYKKLQQQKDDFISIASHELKTPITSLKASLQLLERMKLNPSPMLPKLIDQSTRSMIKISDLVEDLLNVSKMREGQILLKNHKFVVSDLLYQCCTNIRQDGHKIVVEGNLQLEIVADENRIEQVLVNFINNAIKYAPESEKIFLKVELIENYAKISVRDEGPGISAEKLPHLFDRYFRVDNSGAQVSGLGLGLYISADIVARHNGKVGVDSELGKGSTFWFTLPLIV